MDSVKYAAKAIAGFVVGVVTGLITRWQSGELVIPDVDPFDWKGWAILVGVGILGYLGVFVPQNKLSAKQVADGFNKLPLPQQQAVAVTVGRHAKPE